MCRRISVFILILMFSCITGHSQTTTGEPYVRIARIVVDSVQLENYLQYLREGISTAVQVEPGVLRMYAMQDRKNPCNVTIFETYASKAAYDLHILTPHFKKYKTGTLSMVKSLELIDVDPIIFRAKQE